jgi:P pilus assembly chaperone PapD
MNIRIWSIVCFFLCAGWLSAGISIDQVELNLQLKPGEKRVTEIRVSNSGDADIPVRFYIQDWKHTTKGDLETMDSDPDEGAAQWISVTPNQVVLKPGTTQVLLLNVAMPDSNLTGERRAILFAETESLQTQTLSGQRSLGMKVITRLGTKIFLSNQELKPAMEISKIEKVGTDLQVTLRNPGLRHVLCEKGQLNIDLIQGNEKVPFPPFSVLPGMTRMVSVKLPDKSKRVLVVLDYGGADLVAGEYEIP